MKIINDFSSVRRGFGGVAAVCVLLCAACRADDPNPVKQDLNPPPDTVYYPPDGFPGCESMEKLGSPVISPFPNPTSYALQPFRGRSERATQVTAQGGLGAAAPVPVNADGTFCIEVQLLPDSPNNVTFTPWDENGCPGMVTTISLVHKTVTSVDAGMSTVQNLAAGQPADGLNVDSGSQVSFVVDGDANSFTEFSFFDTGSSAAWVRVDLGKVFTVTRLKVKYPPQVDSDYAKSYALVLSPNDAPVDPDPAEVTDWKTVEEVSTGGPEEQDVKISPESARWAALLMYENGGIYLWESFKVAELEVWGQDPNAQPPPPPDRCGN